MNNYTHCFYKPGATNMEDVAVQKLGGFWFGGYGGKSRAAILEETGAELTEIDVAVAAIDKAQRETLCTGPARITYATFMEMLEVLPPQRWMRGGHSEFFHISEHIGGPYVSWYARVGEGDYAKYYTLVEHCGIAHSVLLDMVNKFEAPKKAT